MTEVVGEGIVVIRTDESQVDGKGAGERGGEGFVSGFGGKIKGLAAAAGVAAVAVGVSKVFVSALNFNAAGAKMGAQLGLTQKQSAAAGKIAGNLFTQNYGDSMEEVQSAVGTVVGSIKGMRSASQADLQAASKAALNYASVFDVDVSDAVSGASRLINSGLAKDAPQAFDLLTKASQKVPASLRQDLFDATDEYSQFFSQIGLSGEEAFSTLAGASDRGMFGIDKAGDAVKEFTIRSTDMSSASKAAYKALGLDARTMADDVLAGGDRAGKATQQVVRSLLSMKDPAKQANTALALFGTPLEDLGTKNIPKFLHSLQGTQDGLGKVAGATDKAAAQMNNTPIVQFHAAMRKVQGTVMSLAAQVLPPLITALDRGFTAFQAYLPVIEGALEPVMKSLGETIRTTVAPALTSLFSYLSSDGVPAATSLAETFRTQILPTLLAVGEAIVKNVVPVLMTIGHTIITDVVPAVLSLGGYLARTLFPVFQAVADVIINDVIPVIASLATYLYGTVYPAVLQVVTVVAERLKPVFDTLVQVFLTQVLPTIQKVITQIRTELVPALQPVIERVGQVIGFLVELAAAILGVVLPPLLRFAGFLIEHLLPAVVSIITVLVKIIGWVLDFGATLVNAAKSIYHFADALGKGINDGVRAVIHTIADLPGKILGLGPKMLEAGQSIIGSLVDGLKGAGGLISDVAGNVWKAVRGFLNDGLDKINAAFEFKIDLGFGKSVKVDPPDIPHLATGTRSWRGGVTWVGEEGPELVNLPRGAQVLPHEQSMALAGSGGGSGTTVHIAQMMPHNYSEFERQMQERGRLAALGGRRGPR